MSALDAQDLAYLRATQAEVRPTTVNLFTPTGSQSDGMGGTTTGGLGEGVPIAVRITQLGGVASDDDVPAALAARYDVTELRRITTDLVTLRPGNLLHDTSRGRWYQVVSHGEAEDWTTAQQVWATRIDAPAGA